MRNACQERTFVGFVACLLAGIPIFCMKARLFRLGY